MRGRGESERGRVSEAKANQAKVEQATASLVVTFSTVHQALKCESALGADGINVKLMPVPRRISSSCGISARVENVNPDALCAKLRAAHVEYEGVYALDARSVPTLLARGPHAPSADD